MKIIDLARSLMIGRAAPDLAALILRAAFVAALGLFFWRSALTKLDGFGLAPGAYAQILPAQAAAAGYDPAALAWPWHLVVAGGTAAELLLPALILLGLLTRPAAIAMIGFVLVMTIVDVTGHGVALADIRAERLIWLGVLGALAALGGGALSLDRLLQQRWPARRRAHAARPLGG